MSDKTNADVIRQAYAAFSQGDMPEFTSLLTDDVEWTMQGPSLVPYTGTRHGHEGVAEFFSLVEEALEMEQFEPREFVAQGDTVVVLGYERSLVKLTGRTFEQEWVHVYTLREGKIAKGHIIDDTAAQVVAFDAA
jgi:ketosteroid isomerase-like protein